MRTPTSLLRHLRPFDRHGPDQLAVLEAQADRLALRPGTVVARRGARAREAVVVLAGELVGESDDGGRRVLGPGSWVGHAQLMTGRPHDEAIVVGGAGASVVVVNGPADPWALGALPGLADDAGGAARARALVTGGRPGR